MYRGNTQAVRDKLNSGQGLYMKAKDFEEKAVRVRPILWACNDMPCDILTYLEGWQDVTIVNEKTGKKEIKSKPVRFRDSEAIPDGIPWTKSSYKGGPMKPQLPKPGVGLVVWVYAESRLRVVTFGNVDPVKYFMSLLDPKNEDGSDNEMFIKDLTSVDFVIRKQDDDWTITTQNTKDGPNLSNDTMKALADFHWSWDSWMKGEQVDENNSITYDDVVEIASRHDEGGQVSKNTSKKEENKKSEKSVAPAQESATVKSWKEFKAPSGKLLGDFTLDELEKAKAHVEKKMDLSKPAVKKMLEAIEEGIKELSSVDGEEQTWGDDDIAF